MHADGVDILHPADRDGMVVGIAHNLEFDFFVSFDTFFDQDLVYRGQFKGIVPDIKQFRFIVGKAASGAAERKCRPKNDRIADPFSRCFCFLQIIGDFRGNNRFPDGLAHLLEQFAILRTLNRAGAGSEQFCSALSQDAFSIQLHGKV